MPGRGGRRSDPRLIPGVGDETIEASLLGDLAVLSIANDSHEVCMCVCVCCVFAGVNSQVDTVNSCVQCKRVITRLCTLIV